MTAEGRDGPARFVAAAAQLGLIVDVKTFEQSTRTAEEAAGCWKCVVSPAATPNFVQLSIAPALLVMVSTLPTCAATAVPLTTV